MKKQTEEQVQAEKIFEVDDKLTQILRNYLGSKPFMDVAQAIRMLNSKEFTEKQINTIINVMGKYPYDEVQEIFSLFSTNIKQTTTKPEEQASKAEKEEQSPKVKKEKQASKKK